MNIFCRILSAVLLGGILPGCTGVFSDRDSPGQIAIRNCRPGSVTIDGKADEAVWKQAIRYELRTPIPAGNPDSRPVQPGNVRFACDARFLYVFAEFTDDDIVQYGQDNEDLCKRGDVLELFIRGRSGCYWEIHMTPNNRSAVIFYPNAGRRIFPEAIQRSSRVRCSAVLKGTLNNYRDTDKGYCIEASIPLQLFAGAGIPFGDGWTMMAARYNYSKSLEDVEYSASVVLPAVNYHAVKYYTLVKIIN